MAHSIIRSPQLLQSLQREARALQASLFGNISQQCTVIMALGARPLATGTTTPAAAAAAAADAQTESQKQQPYKTPIYAACVLERLPIVKSPPPAWEAEYKAWVQLQQTEVNLLKQYPQLDNKQRDTSTKGAPSFNADTTAADASGRTDTMKRRLADKLVLLVKARRDALTDASPSSSTAAAADADADAGTSSSGSRSSSTSRGGGEARWTFPHTSYRAGETMRQTAERALREAIGPSQVYFVGNAPMAHLNVVDASSSSTSSGGGDGGAGGGADGSTSSNPETSSSSSSSSSHPVRGRVFFHLAQVVNDPWDVELAPGSGAMEHAWVSTAELGQYIQDARLLDLAHKML